MHRSGPSPWVAAVWEDNTDMKYWIILQISSHLNTPKAEIVEEIRFWKPFMQAAWKAFIAWYVPVVQFSFVIYTNEALN